MFVIKFSITDLTTRNVTQTKFLAIDEGSGGYPCWSQNFGSAKIYNTIGEANKMLESEFFTKNMEYGDGSMSPPLMITQGLELSNTRICGEGFVSIEQIGFISVSRVAVKATVNIPLASTKMMTFVEARKWVKSAGSIIIASNGSNYVFLGSFGVVNYLKYPGSWTVIEYELPMTTESGKYIESIDHLVDVFYPDHTFLSI